MKWLVAACVFKHYMVVDADVNNTLPGGFGSYGSFFCEDEDLSDILFERLQDQADLLHTFEMPAQDRVKVGGLDVKFMKALVTNLLNRYGL